MLKTHKKQLIISSLIILLPIVAGLLLWDRLPDRISTHWGFDGQADGWGGKAFAVFGSPLSILLCHWLCILVTAADPKNKQQHRKAAGMVFWACPMISLYSSALIYGIALGIEWNMASITFALMGILFAAIGNYLPKVKPNYTIGIKTAWALHNEENWNATHRFSGKLWVSGGLATTGLSLLPAELATVPIMIVLAVMTLGSVLYSWLYHRKQLKTGTADPDVPKSREQQMSDRLTRGALIFTAIVLILVGIFLFSGHIDVAYGDDSFTLEASFWSDLTVRYDSIDSMEYREGDVSGKRIGGLGSFRLLLGNFESEELGSYIRYTYYKPEACIVLTVSGKPIVISGRDAAETKAIYEELTVRTEG